MAEDQEDTLDHKSSGSSSEMPQQKEKNLEKMLPCNQDILFFPVQGIYIQPIDVCSFINLHSGISVSTYKDYPMSPRSASSVHHSQSQVHGKKISVNGKDIALFYYRDVFYAIDEKCPHQGNNSW